jgi:site-specific DNA-methyltransferase (cytosine-N4-specific)
MNLVTMDCLDWLRTQPDASVDFVFGSPPYAEKGERYGGKTRKWPTDQWVEWMADVTTEAVRISRGYVIWIVNGAIRKGCYLPACEMLLLQAYARGLICERPVIWHKNPPPNRKDWFVNSWEYCLVFKHDRTAPFFDWKAIAEPPKYKAGGHFRQRDKNGTRRRGGDYPQNALARPHDVLYVTVGGGHLGHPLAHENEAPFPLKLAEKFVLTCCPPGGTVVDPFIGSGTTAHAAELHGRQWTGLDCRQSQIELTRRRIEDVRQQRIAQAS